MSMMGDNLVFFCNGRKVKDCDVDPLQTLDVYLRTKLRLTGTKQGCGQGGCGACTVMVSSVDPETQAISHKCVVACLLPVCLLHGKAVTTVEGIGSTRTRLHAVQERLAKSHGSQCGFCSPGMVMSMYSLLRNNPKPDVQQMLRYLEGNLCRCTGYRSIIDGFKTFCGENCCQVTGGPCQSQEDGNLVDSGSFQPYVPTQEPIFPPELLVNVAEYNQTKTFVKGTDRWIVAATLEELLQLLADNPSAQLIAGNTGGIKKYGRAEAILVSPGIGVKELSEITPCESGVTIGASVTISQLEDYLKDLVDKYPEHQTRAATALLEMLQWFAGQQVRNMATVGGCIAVASSNVDPCIVLMATKTTVTLAKAGGKRRTVPLDKDFFPQPNQSIIERDEIIQSIYIPFTKQNDYIFSQKVAQRHHGCSTAVTCGFRVTFDPEGHRVSDLCLVFGGVDASPRVATKTCNTLIGQPWNQSFLQDVIQSVSAEILPSPHHKLGMSAEYRQSLMTTCLLRFYVKVSKLTGNQEALTGSFAQGQLSDPSLDASYKADGPVSTQIYQPAPRDQPDADPLGRPIVHRAALQQCSGEASYVDDIPLVEGELHLAIVVSSRAHAKIISVDPSPALALVGVEAYIDQSDVTGTGNIFATTEVHCVGQAIGAVVATSHEIAALAASRVQVQYEDLQPVILTLQDAIKERSFLDDTTEFSCGDVEGSMQEADGILEGQFEIGGQEHFYLETHCCVAKPGEDGEMEVFASSQNPNSLQASIAGLLGVPRNRVSCRTKRIGGGFGGKDSHFSYQICALSAKKLGRPVRVRLDRSMDMLNTGGRAPFHAVYRVGYNHDGRIMSCDIHVYVDGGYEGDTAMWLGRNSMLLMDSVYVFSGYRIRTYSCRTNLCPNVAMRGAGQPEGMAVMHNILSEVAAATGVPIKQVQELNFKPLDDVPVVLEGSKPLDMPIFRECWDTCLRLSDYDRRLQEITDFNNKNTWKKRGLAIVPTLHGVGICFGPTPCQGAALVHIYTDGSVMVNHGGVEMGQGLYTKLVQVASRVLEIPYTKIHTSPTATDKVPNATSSGGSYTTDIHGGAVMAACEILKERLEPYRAANPKGTWEEWVQAAYNDRVSLSTTGFYKTPGITIDWEKLKGNPFKYVTLGVGVSEVEIDCLTGEHQLLRTDIVMDVGKSLNPAIDIGQIEGGFIQGYGFFTMEEKLFPGGKLLNRGPDTYKIPTARDIPKEFNVTLLRNMRTPEGHLYSSKGIGEPPFFLGATTFFAIKHALSSSRKDSGLIGNFQFNSPATVENIRMTCGGVQTKAALTGPVKTLKE